MSKRTRPRVEDFTIGWICALSIELAAARETLDEEYEGIGELANHLLGRIGGHNVVVAACLPAGQRGTDSAAILAAELIRTFPFLQIGLVVGVAGGVPSCGADIRLGDVVVSEPKGRYGGVVQYDSGKTDLNEKHFPNGSPGSPHRTLLDAVAKMQAHHDDCRKKVQASLDSISQHPAFGRPSVEDVLFDPLYNHVNGGDTCDKCLREKTKERASRDDQSTVIHYGLVGSGNRVFQDGATRDRISAEYGGILCFETEAAGVMNSLPCLVVRGICDYADSHKYKTWQPYAAAAAAACARELLLFVPPTEPFDQILTRDGINTETMIMCLQWLLFAQQPLTPEELYSAVLAGSDPELVTAWDPADIDQQSVQAFISTHLKGLAEATDTKAKTVQFIRESVREHLLKSDELLERLRPDLSSNLTGLSHERLKTCCQEYIRLCNTKESILKELPDSPSSRQRESISQQLLAHFPFLKYAVCSVFYHADLAAQHGVDQSEFMTTFSLKDWAKTRNIFDKSQRPHFTSDASLLYILAAENAATLIRHLLPSIENLDAREGYSRTPLHIAIENKNMEVLETLLVPYSEIPGQSPAIQDETWQVTPQQRRVAIRDLLDGFDPTRSHTVLLWAVEYDKVDMVKILLNSQRIFIDPGAVDRRNPLSIAARRRHVAVLRLLLASVQDIARGRRAFRFAVENGHADVVEAFLDSGKLTDSTDHNNDWTPLLWAAMNGHGAVVKLLFDYGVGVESKNRHDEMMLSWVEADRHELVRRLLHYNVIDVASRNREHHTPLSWAARTGYDAVVKLLLDSGDKTESKNQDTFKSLTWAAANGHESIVKLLLASGAKTESEDHDAETPLSWAAESGQEEVVKLLLDHGARIECKDRDGRTPLSHAAAEGHETVVGLLLNHGASTEPRNGMGQTPLTLAAIRGYEAVVKVLVKGSANIESKDACDWTPLVYAAENGHEAVVKLLLDCGANANCKDGEGLTPLSYAAENGYETVVKLLLDSGANTESEDGDGRTPLSWADKSGHEAVAKLLLNSGANTESKDREG